MPSSGARNWTASAPRPGGMRPGWRTHALAWLAQRFGPQFVLPTVTALERRDSGQYDNQPEAVAGGLPAAERSHERIVEAVAGALPRGGAGTALAQYEGRHRGGGNALRAAVLGANDGLVSNLSLVMGVAGAAVPGKHDPADRARRAGRRRLLDGDGRMAVGDQLRAN